MMPLPTNAPRPSLSVVRLARRALPLPLPPITQPGMPARTAHASIIVAEPTLLMDEQSGAPVLAYLPLPATIDTDTGALVDVLRRLPCRPDTRTKGLRTQAVTFGSYPRSFRQVACGQAALAKTDPAAHQTLLDWAPVVAGLYQQVHPALYSTHLQLARGVREEWKLAGTPFTSGICNRDSQLAYHYDRGNLVGVWSAMLGLRRDVEGGRLIIPAYDVAVEVADRSLTLFDGQALVHGVSPFVKREAAGYRFTVVYYSLAAMCHCEGTEAEAAKQRARLHARRRHGPSQRS